MNVAAEEGASGRVRVYLTESMSPTEAEVMNSWLGDRRSGNGSGPRVVEAADEEALADLDRAIALGADWTGYLLRARTRQELGDAAGAIADFRRVLEENPQHTEAREALAGSGTLP